MRRIYDQCMSQNLYTYVGNNPINYIDPMGHNREDIAYLESQEEQYIKRVKEDHENETAELLGNNGYYATADEAAIVWADSVMPESFKDDVEFGGLIYRKELKLSDGSIIYGYGCSGAEKGTFEEVHTDKLPLPKGTELVAYLHTHGAPTENYQNDDFSYYPNSSSGDYYFANIKGVPLYLVYQPKATKPNTGVLRVIQLDDIYKEMANNSFNGVVGDTNISLHQYKDKGEFK